MNKLVQRYEVSTIAAQFGVVRFSTEASVVISLGRHRSLSSLQAAVSTINYQPGTINTAQGIELALKQFSINGRSQVPQVMIVITGGKSNDFVATKSAVELSSERGIGIFAVGIRDGVSELATTSASVFTITGFSEESFDAILSDVVRGTCNGKWYYVPQVPSLSL